MNFVKNASYTMICGSLLTVAALQAAVGTLPGTISLQINSSGTVSVSVLKGKSFSVPAQVNVVLTPQCTISGVVSLWQASVSIPVTFSCGCSTQPIITTGLESNIFTSTLPLIIEDFTLSASSISTTGFVYTASILIGSCNGVPVSQAAVLAALSSVTISLSFAAICVK